MQGGAAAKPVLFVMNLQEGVVNPVQHAGGSNAHLQKTTRDIFDFVGRARASGVDIVWLFHRHNEQRTSLLTDSFRKAKNQLTRKDEKPLARLPVAAGDRFWVLPHLEREGDKGFSEHIKAMGLKERSSIAGCGFEHERPTADCTYLWAHNFSQEGLLPTILSDLTDNREPVSADGKAQANISFLQRLHKERILWTQSRDWLQVVRETTRPPDASGTPSLNVPVGVSRLMERTPSLDCSGWLGAATRHCSLRNAASRLLELAS
jgi:hypothetical protein